VSLPVCGDSVQAEGEQCDDGNATDGDGCSATCKPEAGWVCSTLPCKRISVCGDGFITGTESCDDSNVEAGDGCSATCALEYKAPTQRAAESTPAEDQVSSEGEESEEPSL
jgi:cysteine-rich repeat protein